VQKIDSNTPSKMNEELFLSGNDPTLQQDAKYLGTITQDFVVVAETLKETSYNIRKNGFEYPIFPICKEDLGVGQLLLHRSEIALQWNYNVSLLDEFVQRKLITEENIKVFKENYKNPDEFCCLFVIDKEFMNFVYVPYPED
jgi:hypothetical protein